MSQVPPAATKHAAPNLSPAKPQQPLRLTIAQRILLIVSALAIPCIVAVLVVKNGKIADPQGFMEGMSRMAITYGVITLIAAVAYMIGRRRTLWPAVGIFTVLMSVVTITFCLGLSRANKVAAAAHDRAERAAQAKRVEAELDGVAARIREAAKQEQATGNRDALQAAAADGLAKFDKIAANETGNTAIVARATAEVVRKVLDATAEYRKALDAYKADGGLKAASLELQDSVIHRRTLLRAAAEKNDTLTSLIETQPETLRKRCIELGMGEKAAQSSADAFTKALDASIGLKMQALEKEALVLSDKRLAVLETAWGHWSVVDGTIKFDETFSQEQIADFNQTLARIREIGPEQAKLRQEKLAAPKPKE